MDEPGEGRFRDEAQKVIFEDIEGTLASIGIDFDVYYNERSLYDEGKLEEALADLREKGLIYDSEGAVWFKATDRGLDRDRVVIKSSGEPTYLMPDIAYHREKFRRGFDLVIDVQGADHIEQFPFVREATSVLGVDPDRIQLVMHQFVTITSGGERVKQSTRKATFVTVDELVSDVGRDVFSFFYDRAKARGPSRFRSRSREGQKLAQEPRLLCPVRPRPNPRHRTKGDRVGACDAGPASVQRGPPRSA